MNLTHLKLAALAMATTVLGLVGVASAKPHQAAVTKSKTTATFQIVGDTGHYAGKVTSGKGVCKSKRKITLGVLDKRAPGGESDFASTRTDSKGVWMVDANIRPVPSAPVIVSVKAKKVGKVKCGAGTKELG